MGRRGPKKKLKALRRLEGRRLPIEAPGVEALGEPFIAEHLSDDARACIEVIKQSMPEKVYSALDSFALAAFATAWAIHKKATTEISNPKFKWIVENTRGNKTTHPWIKIANAQLKIISALGDRLGLDPRSRSALNLPSAGRQREPIEDLIGRRRSYGAGAH